MSDISDVFEGTLAQLSIASEMYTIYCRRPAEAAQLRKALSGGPYELRLNKIVNAPNWIIVSRDTAMNLKIRSYIATEIGIHAEGATVMVPGERHSL
jgi:hypothetical protein